MSVNNTELATEHTLQYNRSSDRFSNESMFESIRAMSVAEVVEDFIYTKAIFAVCVFGIGGNLLNLIVLSQRSLMCTMKRMEKSAHYGLIALAVSDLFVCITALSSVFYRKNGGFAHANFDFRLVYKLYGNGVINTFILSSTWLTVTMALSRYIAICHPLQARQIIGKTFTVASVVAVGLGSVIFNVPRFLRDEPSSINSSSTGWRRMYFVFPGPLRRHPYTEQAYYWTYFTLGIALPLCVLIFSNAKLIIALRNSKKFGSSFQQSTSTQNAADSEQAGDKSAHRITQTLIVIIAFFVLLFVPSELLNFFLNHATSDAYRTRVFNTVQAIGNLLQAINFAVNFVLYCIVNKHFRRTMYRLASCLCCRRSRSPGDETMITDRTLSQKVAGTVAETEHLCGRHATERHSTRSRSRLTSSSPSRPTQTFVLSPM